MGNEADLPVWPVVFTEGVPFEFKIDWGGTMNWYLFNLTADPTESNNLMNEHPEIVGELSGKLAQIKSTAQNSSWCESTPDSAYRVFNTSGFIGPWLSES